MRPPEHNPNVRKGRFLWMEAGAREQFLGFLTKRISDGYYSSDRVIAKIVEELAPVLRDVTENERD